MQDRFKFRVWQIVRAKGKDILVFMEFSECSAINLNNYIHHSDCIIEQCTGLKDKNGKLIYEGDIVEVPVLYNGIPTGKKQRCKVYYKHGAFNIYAVKSEYLKVIGNIHENPKLLEDRRKWEINST